MLDASLRSTHTYIPLTMIWVIFGFVGFIVFLSRLSGPHSPVAEGMGTD